LRVFMTAWYVDLGQRHCCPTRRSSVLVASRKPVGAELSVELVEQRHAVGMVEPGILLARVEAEGHGRAEGEGGILADVEIGRRRSEEHTSELQSRENRVCRLLLE